MKRSDTWLATAFVGLLVASLVVVMFLAVRAMPDYREAGPTEIPAAAGTSTVFPRTLVYGNTSNAHIDEWKSGVIQRRFTLNEVGRPKSVTTFTEATSSPGQRPDETTILLDQDGRVWARILRRNGRTVESYDYKRAEWSIGPENSPFRRQDI